MINALRRFYNSFGDRGVMMVIFTVSVIVHSLLTMHMELPAVNPDEIGVASVAAFYSGRDWSALMGQVYYYYGYVQAIFYAPLFLFFSNSYALYKACLIMNGVLMSFIPVIAYHVSTKLGVSRVWQKITVAFCCGAYITYIAHSKFMWNEAICSLLPWVLMWVMFMSRAVVGRRRSSLRGLLRGALQAAGCSYRVRYDRAYRAYLHEPQDIHPAGFLPGACAGLRRGAFLQKDDPAASLERQGERQHHGSRGKPRAGSV